MSRVYLFAFMAFMGVFNALGATVTGRIVDSGDKSALADATVRLLKDSKDSTFVKGVTTDENGYFWFTDVKRGKYIVSVSYIGFDSAKKSFTVSDEESGTKLGEISMKENTIMLKETTVVGVKTEIKVKEDTVEYNADSYKTQPAAVVEDLLKRLPGVEVGSDGKITANGKEVTKILLDGKEFFADDPKVASKNIPVKMVDKLQVVDRKSDLARTTGVDDGEDETVINLTVKKGMNNGWFGTVSAGYGTDDRYNANAMINYFNNGNQFTILGGGNNINDLSFTDGGASRFQRFGGSEGINKSQSAGLNFNVGNKDTFRVGGSVMYSHSDSYTENKSNRQYLFTDSTSYYNSESQSRDKGHNVRGDFRLKWEVDSFNTLEFRPNFSLNFNDSEKGDVSQTMAGDANRTLVNSSLSAYSSSGTSYEFGGELVYNHKFRSHPGRSYSTQLRYNFSDVTENGTTYTKNKYYLIDDNDEVIDQVYDNHRWSNSVQGRLTWTEPLGNVKNARFLTVAYRGQYKFNNADKYVYDLGKNTDPVTAMVNDANFREAVAGKYTTLALTNPTLLRNIVDDELGGQLNTDQSDSFRNDFFSESLQLGFKQVRKLYNLDAGFSVNSSMSRSRDLMNDARTIPARWVWNFAPYARFRYKFSKSRSLAFDYRTRTSEPSMSQLQPVADVSNPLRIVVGNPNLKATFTHRLNMRFSDFNQDAQRSIMAMLSGQFARNSIISTTDYNEQTGGQTTTYANVDGVWNVNAMGMISFPFRNKNWQYSTMTSLRYSNTVGYNNGQLNRSGSFYASLSPGLAFRTDAVDLEIRPNYNLQTTHNSVQSSANRTIHTYGGMFNGSYYTPFGIVLNTDLSFSGSQGYSEGYDTKQWLWNATLSYQFLKGQAATISAKVYDILHQNQNISRSVTANYIQDSEYNSLTRYMMFTFTYKFTTFGDNSKNPNMDYDGFGGRGHGGHPGPPPVKITM